MIRGRIGHADLPRPGNAIVELAKVWDAKFTAMDARVDAVDALRTEMDTKFTEVLGAIRSLRS